MYLLRCFLSDGGIGVNDERLKLKGPHKLDATRHHYCMSCPYQRRAVSQPAFPRDPNPEAPSRVWFTS